MTDTPAPDVVVTEAGFQPEVAEWMLACFGPEIAADRLERADRFTEEALELAQTVPGFTAERAHALVDYVFGRDVGERGQEVGGVMVTLAALCNTFDISIRAEAERELARIWTKVDAIRAKQATKPVGSALPVADTRLSTQSAMQARIEELEAGLSGLLKWANNVCRARGIATGQLAVERARATLSNISEKP